MNSLNVIILSKASLSTEGPVLAVVVPFSTVATVLRHGNKQVEGNIPVKRSSKLLTYLVSR